MDLKFDKRMTVDTSLAQDYLKNENVSEIYEKLQNPNRYFDGKAYYETLKNSKPCSEMSLCLQNLVQKLKDNTNLIAQLEYLNRKFPIEDTKTQVNLIIQQLHYLSSGKFFPDTVFAEAVPSIIRFTIYYDTPLLRFGHVLRSLMYQPDANVYFAGKETLPICQLFIKLCYDSGFTNLTVRVNTYDKIEDRTEQRGAVGVITGKSDIDSAVDVFLESSKRAPWSLRKILVQEGVYQQFKAALTWKCNLMKTGKPAGACPPDVIEQDGRKFLIDCVRNSNLLVTEVAVEAYRTNKELLSLLNLCRPFYLSLWASDVAEINEIAYNAPSQVVWVNNFADFRGPIRISDALFSNFILEIVSSSDLVEQQRSWLKLEDQVRYEILGDTLDKIAAKMPEVPFYTEMKNAYRKLELQSSNTFVHVGKDYMCVGVSAHPETAIAIEENTVVDKSFLKLILQGHLLLVHTTNLEISCLIDGLNKGGAPISVNPHPFDALHDGTLCNFNLITKVIWTNSGTIFAN